MGDKWARRLQQELNSSNPKFDYRYDPGIKSAGLAPREGQTVILNPLRGGKLESPDRLASTLIHEYAHKYQGPVKWAAAEGEMASGSATKGTYNETRAFLAEAQFNNNLQNARLLNGKKFDDSALRELRTLMDADALQAAAPEQSFARGKAAADNLQKGLDKYYGSSDPARAAEKLSAFRGGNMTDLRQRLFEARAKGDAEYQRVLKEIQEKGGKPSS
jgi:hypothetical protein